MTEAVKIHGNLGVQTTNQYGITETNLIALNPYQNFANQGIPEIYPRRGDANYNALYASINQRLLRGLSVLANYTWSKELDNVPDTNTGANSGGFGSAPPQNPFNYANERSVASFDQPSRLKAGFTYTLQAGKGRAVDFHSGIVNHILGNITTAGILSMASGFPSSVVLGQGISGSFQSITPVGLNGCIAPKIQTTPPTNYCATPALPASYALRPNIVKGVPLISKNWKDKNVFTGNFTPYFNLAAFQIPGSANDPQFGNAPRLLADARSPRETFFDMRFLKAITFKRRYQLNINATFGNVFNHPVYYGAGKSLYSATPVNLNTGQLGTPTQNIAFGQLQVGQSGGISRVIRVGSEFNF